MRFPLDGIKRAMFVADLADAEANNACISWGLMVARGWDPDEAYDVLVDWLEQRTVATVDALNDYVKHEAA